MKTIVLLLVSLMPFALLSQGKSNSVDIKKPMPSNIVVSLQHLMKMYFQETRLT